MNTLFAAIDAFSNPDSVWYYVVGVLFLVLIFAALAVYIVVSNKKKKAQGDAAENAEANGDEKVEDTATAGANADEANAEAKADDNATAEEKADGPIEEKNVEIKQEDAPAEKAEADEPKATEPEEPKAEKKSGSKAKDKNAEPVIKIVEKKQEPATKSDTAEKTESKKSAPKKSATAKAFIDRLLAAKSAHGVYNELKNTVLSYPGIKAKLTKDDEQFVYVDKKVAAVALDGENITLYLALDKDAVPSGFDVQKADGDFGIKTTVAETDIDSARKLIVFAMNVSMLTRNDKKRYVDYIQKAKDAKQRAKKK